MFVIAAKLGSFALLSACAEVDERTRRTHIAGCGGLTQSVCGKPNKGRRGRRPLRRLLW
ncbi:MAG: hypothetical protein LBO63_07085 [Oscillospiraceae bacterium]|nr:hypothetical protein [Oscillospiraceae bacterium]